MTVLRTIGNFCLIIITAFAVIVSLAYVYYHFTNKDITEGVNNIDNQVGLDIQEVLKSDELTEEKKDELKDRYFLEVNYYSNDKHNGIELQELKMNYFTSYKLTSADYRSTGMQYLGNYEGLPLNAWNGDEKHGFINPFSKDNNIFYGQDEKSLKVANEYIDRNFNYYDYTNEIHWNGITNENGQIATTLTRQTQFIIKIDNRAFAITLDKYVDKNIGERKNFFGAGWKVGDIYNRYYYTYGSLFQSCMQAVRTNSAGYGDYYITVDLSSLFSIKEYDAETGKYKTDDVTDIIKTYSVLKFHYDENGARTSSQSMFGIIDNNSKYDLVEDKIDTTYWQERMTYNLDCNSKLNGKDLFTFRYSEEFNGYFVSLSIDAKKMFREMPRTKLNVTFDCNCKDKPIVGLDFNAFENVELDTLTVKSSQAVTFYLLDNSLTNTNLQTLKRSYGVTFNIAENAISAEYTEVIL